MASMMMAADIAVTCLCLSSLLANTLNALAFHKVCANHNDSTDTRLKPTLFQSKPPGMVGLVGLVNRDFVVSYALALAVPVGSGFYFALSLGQSANYAASVAVSFLVHFLIQVTSWLNVYCRSSKV